MLVTITGGPPYIPDRPRRAQTFHSLGEFAHEVGLPFLVTTPDRLLQRGGRTGWKFVPGQRVEDAWRLQEVDLGGVVYDAMYLDELKRFGPALRQVRVSLNRLGVPTFNPVLPGKDVVYRCLAEEDLRGGGVPMTWYEVHPRQVLDLLGSLQQLWIKPVFGSGGRNVAFIQRLGADLYQFTAERFYGREVREQVAGAGLRKLVATACRRGKYVAQAHVPLLETHDRRKVDFRVTVQRGNGGEWELIALIARFGKPGSNLTNYHAGADVLSLTQPAPNRRLLLGQLGLSAGDLTAVQRLALSVAQRLQSCYPTLALLGLDIGRTVDGRQYVYDCNGRPGRDILTDDEVAASMRAVAAYARHLVDHSALLPSQTRSKAGDIVT